MAKKLLRPASVSLSRNKRLERAMTPILDFILPSHRQNQNNTLNSVCVQIYECKDMVYIVECVEEKILRNLILNFLDAPCNGGLAQRGDGHSDQVNYSY